MVDLDGFGIWSERVEMIGCRLSVCRNVEVVREKNRVGL